MIVGYILDMASPKIKNFAMIFSSPCFNFRHLNFQDFGASERGKKPVPSTKGQPVVSRDQKENPDVHVWEEDDVDSVKVTSDSSYFSIQNLMPSVVLLCETD